jgi:hypothetical protein
MSKSSSYKDRARKMGVAKTEKSSITLKEGSNCLRVVPTPAGKTSPEVVMEYQVHYEVGPNKITCTCGHAPDKKGHCYLCDKKKKELVKAGKQGRAEKLEPKLVTVVQASIVTEDDGKLNFSKAKIWRPTGKTAGALLTQILASKKRDYVDPKKGYNINIERTGTSYKETRYGPIEPDDESTRVPSSVLEDLKPFDQIIPAYDEDQQKAAYAGKEYKRKGESESESSSSESESESSSTEEESEDLDDVFEDDSKESESEEKKDKKKAKKSTKKKKESESEEESSESESESDSEEEEESDSKESESGSDEEESESEEMTDKPKSKKKGKK